MLKLELYNVAKFTEFRLMFVRELRVKLQMITGQKIQITRTNKPTVLTDEGESATDGRMTAKISVAGMTSKAAMLEIGRAIVNFVTQNHLSAVGLDVIIDAGIGQYHYDGNTNELKADDEFSLMLLDK